MRTKLRVEERYLAKDARVNELVSSLKVIAVQQPFTTNINETIYFDSAEHELPFEYSFKARRYLSARPAEEVLLNPQEPWILEIKGEVESDKGGPLKEKQREDLTLGEIIAQLGELREFQGVRLVTPLSPFILDVYQRAHFLVGGNKGFRVTVDTRPQYYSFPDELRAVLFGGEDYARVELKISNPDLDPSTLAEVLAILRSVGAVPVVSKKDMAFNFYYAYLRRQKNVPVKESDTEIEAKLSLTGDQQGVFNAIKRDFAAGIMPGFTLVADIPGTLVSGKLNSFIVTDDSGYLRVSIKGESKVVTVKDDMRVVEDGHGLGCILRRREIKTPFSPIGRGKEEVTMYRKRKYFIVKSDATGGSYCILVDRCAHGGSVLFQMEVEATLLRPAPEQEAVAVGEVAQITRFMVDRYPFLQPTTLTKKEWLTALQ